VLTKADKLKSSELAAVEAKTAESIRKRAAAHPMILVTSAEKGTGLDALRAEIAAFSTSR
jgi:GTP-binding protein